MLIRQSDTFLLDLHGKKTCRSKRFRSIRRANAQARYPPMSIPITLVFSDGTVTNLPVAKGGSLLEAARAQGIALLVDCEEGRCGTCQAQVSCGTLDMGEFNPAALSDSERAGGAVLLCRARAREAAVLDVPYGSDDALVTSDTESEATVASIEEVSEGTARLTVQTGEALAFLPGQYVNITTDGSVTRPFSMANMPGLANLRFYVALRSGGQFSSWLTSRARIGDTIRLTPPRGTFYLRQDACPRVFVAGGTGLAPYLAMLSLMAQDESAEVRERSIALLLGARHENQLFDLGELDRLRDRLPNLRVRIACDETTSSAYVKGRVTELLESLPIDQRASVYACGPPPMVDATRVILKRKQIRPSHFFAEKFTA